PYTLAPPLLPPFPTRRSSDLYGHTATLMTNGEVLVTGGIDLHTLTILGSAEVYNPASDSWTAAAPLATARYLHAGTLLGNGDVLDRKSTRLNSSHVAISYAVF